MFQVTTPSKGTLHKALYRAYDKTQTATEACSSTTKYE